MPGFDRAGAPANSAKPNRLQCPRSAVRPVRIARRLRENPARPHDSKSPDATPALAGRQWFGVRRGGASDDAKRFGAVVPGDEANPAHPTEIAPPAARAIARKSPVGKKAQAMFFPLAAAKVKPKRDLFLPSPFSPCPLLHWRGGEGEERNLIPAPSLRSGICLADGG